MKRVLVRVALTAEASKRKLIGFTVVSEGTLEG